MDIQLSRVRSARESIHAPAVRGTAWSIRSRPAVSRDPPTSTAGTAPSNAATTPRLEFAEFVRGADEHRVHRADTTADLVGRLQLHQQVADVDADHVARAEHGERDQRQPELVDRPNTSVATPNTTTPPNIQRPTCRVIGPDAQHQAGERGADAGAARSQPSRSGRRAECRPQTPAAAPSRRRTAPRTDRAKSRRAPAGGGARNAGPRARRAD